MAVTFTAESVARFRATGPDREEIYDDKVVGLGLRVSPSGKKVWFVQYRVKGDPRRRKLTLDAYPAMSLKDARDAGKDALLKAARGHDPAGKKQEAKQAPTVAELIEEFIERHVSKNRTRKQDEYRLRKYVLPAWGPRKIHDIKRRDVVALIDDIHDQGIRGKGAPIQANRVLSLVRTMFKWAIQRDLLEHDPCYLVKPAAPAVARERVLTEDEIREVWRAFEKQNLRVCTAFKMRLITAQRGGEIESMRWQDLDLEARWWTIPAERAKNKHSHRVPLSVPAVKLLEALKAETGNRDDVFASLRREGPLSGTKREAVDVQRDSGVTFWMHDLRRTAASFMTSMGIPRFTVSKILNHVEPGVTRVYDRHSYDPEKRDALDAWATRLEAIIGRPLHLAHDDVSQVAAEPPEGEAA